MKQVVVMLLRMLFLLALMGRGHSSESANETQTSPGNSRLVALNQNYGNYCGYSTGSGELSKFTSRKPIDALDKCCQEHDGCHKSNCEYSSENCRCQQNLSRCASEQRKRCSIFSLTKFCRYARSLSFYAEDVRQSACYGNTATSSCRWERKCTKGGTFVGGDRCCQGLWKITC